MKTGAFFSWGKAEARKSTKEGKGKMRTNTRKFRLAPWNKYSTGLALTSLTLMALLLGLGVEIVSADPGTVYVDGTQGTDQAGCGTAPGAAACKTIQYAIDNIAVAGDTINVAAGTYDPVTISKSITLKGGALPTIDGHQSQSCITIKADNVVIDGFVLFNGTHGIYMNDAGKSYNLTIRNCTIKNNTEWSAVYLRQNDADKNVTVLVESNVFEWNGNDNLAIYDEAYTQAHPDGFYGYRWIVRKNIFNPCGPSPNWDYSSLGLQPALGVLVENNTFNSYWGIWLDNARYIVIKNNTLSYSLGNGGAGIVVWCGTAWPVPPIVTKYVTIENNEIHGFKSDAWLPEDGKGIVVGGAENVTITSNRIYENTIGIWLNNNFINCNGAEINNPNPNWIEGVEIHFNNIENNTDYGVQNLFASPDVDATHNWWGDASGPYHPDTNPDGKGNAVSDNVDYDPWLGAGVEVAKSETVTGTATITETTTGGDVTINATAGTTHTVTTARYESNPGGGHTFVATGYYDVHLDDVTGVNSVTIEFCPADASTVIYYWDGANWLACGNQHYADGCVVVTIPGPPGLDYLTGGPFASGYRPVGGITFPNDPVRLLAPWVGLAALMAMAVAVVVTSSLVRR